MSEEQLKQIIKQYVEENKIKEIKIFIEELYAGKKQVDIEMR